jgi:hypothetical protein
MLKPIMFVIFLVLIAVTISAVVNLETKFQKHVHHTPAAQHQGTPPFEA